MLDCKFMSLKISVYADSSMLKAVHLTISGAALGEQVFFIFVLFSC